MNWADLDWRKVFSTAAVVVMLMGPFIADDPVAQLPYLAGMAIAAAVAVVVIVRFRGWWDRRVHLPSQGAKGFLGRGLKGYASYVVGFYTVVAVLVVFTVIGHFV